MLIRKLRKKKMVEQYLANVSYDLHRAKTAIRGVEYSLGIQLFKSKQAIENLKDLTHKLLCEIEILRLENRHLRKKMFQLKLIVGEE